MTSPIIPILDVPAVPTPEPRRRRRMDAFGMERRRPEVPYPGLRSFEGYEHLIFFGREKHTDELLKRLLQRPRRLLSVVGTSGCGKSSLVRAGLVPALEAGIFIDAGSQWRAEVLHPGRGPFTELARAVIRAYREPQSETGKTDSEVAADTEVLARILAISGPLGLVDILRIRPLPDQANLLLVLDQFEEIFNYRASGTPGARQEANDFIALLLATSEQREAPVYSVLTMRSEFIGQCAVFAGLAEALNDSQFLTPRLDRQQLAEAIIGPARVFRTSVDPALVAQLLDDVYAVSEEADQLPLLQHALTLLWNRRDTESITADTSPVLTLEEYMTVGDLPNRLETVLPHHLDEIYSKLSPVGKRIAAATFRRITHSQAGIRTRDPARIHNILAIIQPRVLTESSLVNVAAESLSNRNEESSVEITAALTPEAFRAEFLAFVEAFRSRGRYFLHPYEGELTDITRLDITHEVLIRQWPRLSAWMDDEARAHELFDRLYSDASRHRIDPASVALWGDPNLSGAEGTFRQQHLTDAWAARYTAPTGERYTAEDFQLVQAFLSESRKTADIRATAERQFLAREAEFAKEQARQAKVARKRSQKFSWTFGVATVGLSILLAATAYEVEKALDERNKAQKEQKTAVTARKRAQQDREKALRDKAIAQTAAAVARQTLSETKVVLTQTKKSVVEANTTLRVAIRAREATLSQLVDAQKTRNHLAQDNANLESRNANLESRNVHLIAQAKKATTDYEKQSKINGGLTAANAALKVLTDQVQKQNRQVYGLVNQNTLSDVQSLTAKPGQEDAAVTRLTDDLEVMRQADPDRNPNLPTTTTADNTLFLNNLPKNANEAITLAVSAASRYLPLRGSPLYSNTATANGLPSGNGIPSLTNPRSALPDKSSVILPVLSSAGMPQAALPPSPHAGAEAAFSSNGKRVASVAPDGSVQIWDTTDGHLCYTIPSAPNALSLTYAPASPAFGPDQLVVVSAKSVTTWLIQQMPERDQLLSSYQLALPTDNKFFRRLVSESLVVADPPSFQRALFLPDGGILAATQTGIVRWDKRHHLVPMDKGTPSLNQQHKDILADIDYAPSSHTLLTASADGTCLLWNLDTGVQKMRLLGQLGLSTSTSQPTPSSKNIYPFLFARFEPDDTHVVALDNQGDAYSWNFASNNPIPSLSTPILFNFLGSAYQPSFTLSSSLASVALSPDGLLIGGASDGSWLLGENGFQEKTPASLSYALFHSQGSTSAAVTTIAFSPQKDRVLAQYGDGRCEIWSCSDSPISSLFVGSSPTAIFDPKSVNSSGPPGVLALSERRKIRWNPQSDGQFTAMDRFQGLDTLTLPNLWNLCIPAQALSADGTFAISVAPYEALGANPFVQRLDRPWLRELPTNTSLLAFAPNSPSPALLTYANRGKFDLYNLDPKDGKTNGAIMDDILWENSNYIAAESIKFSDTGRYAVIVDSSNMVTLLRRSDGAKVGVFSSPSAVKRITVNPFVSQSVTPSSSFSDVDGLLTVLYPTGQAAIFHLKPPASDVQPPPIPATVVASPLSIPPKTISKASNVHQSQQQQAQQRQTTILPSATSAPTKPSHSPDDVPPDQRWAEEIIHPALIGDGRTDFTAVILAPLQLDTKRVGSSPKIYAITGGADGAVRIWPLDSANLPAQTPSRTYRIHFAAIRSLQASADGQYILAVAADGTAKTFPLDLTKFQKALYKFKDRSVAATAANNGPPSPLQPPRSTR